MVAEWLFIAIVGYLYSGVALLDFDASVLQQTGEHNESATLPLLAELSIWRYQEIPLWNHYMLTGFPHVGDLVNHFWNPVSTLSVIAWGGINGMKVSVFISFLLAGFGQWLFAHAFGLRGSIRLWSSLLFMTSGGLAMLWRAGWYELLLGAAWFPWCYAGVWWALRRRDRASIVLAALCVVMVLSTGGGYYPFYLSGSLSVLVVMSLVFARAHERWEQLRRAVVIVVLSAGLLAVMLLPIIDGFRYTLRQAPPDPHQGGSQTIPYALVNYLVSEPEWFNTTILGNSGGWNWFYIGALPLAGLALIPLALRSRRRRTYVFAVAAVLLFLLAWHANRHTIFRHIYDWLPWLYTLRFPGRLLIVATSPLLVLAGLGLQHLFQVARDWIRSFSIIIARQGERHVARTQRFGWVAPSLLLLLLFFSFRDVYLVNQSFAFARQNIDPKSFAALSWLKNYDPDLYYTNIGGGVIIWGWTPAVYTLEMPMINFNYNRQVATHDWQRRPEAPFFAKPKYMLAPHDQPRPADARFLRDFDGIGLWHLPDALPYAFNVSDALLRSGAPITPDDVAHVEVKLDGPNRVVASADTTRQDAQLVVLVSDYPGWQVSVDGQPAPMLPANGYLGTRMLPGQHTYTFTFSPPQYYVGLGISLLTLVIVFGMLLPDSALRPLRNTLKRRARQGSGSHTRAYLQTGEGE